MSLDFVVKLTAFPAPFSYDAFRIEKFILKGCRAGDFVVRINHAKRTLTFGNQPLALKRTGSDDAFLGVRCLCYHVNPLLSRSS